MIGRFFGCSKVGKSELGPIEACSGGVNVPLLIHLGESLNAAIRVAADADDDGDLRLLFAPGSAWVGHAQRCRFLDHGLSARDVARMASAFAQT